MSFVNRARLSRTDRAGWFPFKLVPRQGSYKNWVMINSVKLEPSTCQA
jgi:hypothetical protein